MNFIYISQGYLCCSFFFKENLSIQIKETPYFLLRRKTILKFKKTRNNFLKHAFCLGYFIFSISFFFFKWLLFLTFPG